MTVTQRKARPMAKSAPAGRWTHYVSPKLATKIRAEKGGYGLYAMQTIQPGELLVMWGGDVVTSDRLTELSPRSKRHSIQIEENLYLVPHQMPEAGDFVNHSCDPNAGLSGQTGLIAIRAVEAGEEICYDYAMSDGSPYDEFRCKCGALSCRGRVTGNDWALPHLQLRYGGYFSPYLQRRIQELRMFDQTPTLELARFGFEAAT
jgi:hypothetical protein